MSRHVCVVVTARATYSRIKTALEALRDRDDIQLSLVVSGSALLDRYGSAVLQIEKDGFDITERVNTVLEGDKPSLMAKTTGIGMLELSTVLDNLAPDVVVTVADRYETLATAVAAAYMNIPLAHVQGGEVSGSIDEKVRHAVTKLADLHLVCTDKAGERVRKMGERDDRVFMTGCPSVDIAARVLQRPELSFDPFEQYGGVGEKVDLSQGYVVVLQHPVTTEYEGARAHVSETLHAASALDLPVLWFWPNVDAGTDGTSRGIRSFREQEDAGNMHFFKNMAPEDFLRLILNSRCLIGNSSVGIRECSYLGVPVVDVGSRQEGREKGPNVRQVGYDRTEILGGARSQIEHGPYPRSDLYGDGKAGPRIAEVLATAPLETEKKLIY